MTKSISGKYLDEKNFTHTVFYNPSRNTYTKTIQNAQMKWCSHAEYTKEQILNQIEGMKKGFDYLGLTFYPYLKLRGKDADFVSMSKRCYDIGLTPKGWNHDDFYKASYTKRYDLFLCNGIVVIPASNYLFEYK